MESKDIFNNETLKRHNKFVAKNKRMEAAIDRVDSKGSGWVFLSHKEFLELERKKNA